MRSFLIAWILLAGCYAPAAPSGAPCSPSGDCPDGQTCVLGFCTITAGPGPDAGTTANDPDGDHVTNDRDNCPAVANPDQANEDGDKFGEACDPCPQLKDDVGADSDGDGIGDLCDPNAMVKDRRWLYEGFHTGLPGWPTRTLNWTVAGDKLRAMSDNSNDTSEYIVAPFAVTGVPDNFSVTMTVTADALLGTRTDHSIGIEIYDSIADKGVDCAIDAPIGAATILYLGDEFTNGLDTSIGFLWSLALDYRITFTRHGNQYTCVVVGPFGTQTRMGTSNIVPRDGNAVDIWAYGTVARFGSVQIVGTP